MLRGIVFTIAGLLLLVAWAPSARAATYLGTAAADAALDFDPFQPDAAAPAPVVEAVVSADAARLAVIPVRDAVLAPSAVAQETTMNRAAVSTTHLRTLFPTRSIDHLERWNAAQQWRR